MEHFAVSWPVELMTVWFPSLVFLPIYLPPTAWCPFFTSLWSLWDRVYWSPRQLPSLLLWVRLKCSFSLKKTQVWVLGCFAVLFSQPFLICSSSGKIWHRRNLENICSSSYSLGETNVSSSFTLQYPHKYRPWEYLLIDRKEGQHENLVVHKLCAWGMCLCYSFIILIFPKTF